LELSFESQAFPRAGTVIGSTMPSPEPSGALQASAYLVDVRWGVAYPLTRVCTGIGRDGSNPVLIRDTAASRSHCEIQRNGEEFTLHPIGSADTQLNGTRVSGPRRLAEGDVITVAYSRLRFTHEPPTDDLVLAPAQPAVDPALAGRTTEVREIVTPDQLRELRHRLLRPVELPWYRFVGMVIGGAIVVAVLVAAAIHFLLR
jgi:hypothetical protein